MHPEVDAESDKLPEMGNFVTPCPFSLAFETQSTALQLEALPAPCVGITCGQYQELELKIKTEFVIIQII